MAGSGVFTGVALARVDGKGRVALPSALRSGLPDEANGHIFVTLHESKPCLVGAGAALRETLDHYVSGLEATALSRSAPFDRDSASIRLHSGETVPVDKSGRFTVPEVLAATEDMGTELAFFGRGPVFEIWDLDQLMAKEGEGFAAQQGLARTLIKLRERDDARKAARP